MNRSRIAVKNSIAAILFQIVNLAFSVFIPRWIIQVYGSEINGLTSNINQYLNVLNLLQAGLLAASGFEMYKPMTEGRYDVTGSIYFSAKRHFSRLSRVYFLLAIVIIPTMLIGRSSHISAFEITLSVVILTLSGALSFKYYCGYDIIFSVYQQKYLLFIAQFLERAVYYLGIFFCLFFRCHYIVMYVGHLVGTVVKLIFLKCKYGRTFRALLLPYSEQTNYKVRNQFHLLGNQIVFRIIDGFPIIIVTRIYDLNYASIYSIYILITNVFKYVFDAVYNAVSPSMGVLFAEGKKEACTSVFDCLQSCSFIVLNIISVCLGSLFLPFIKLYIDNDLNYMCSIIAMLITMQTILYVYFSQFDIIISITGTFNLTLKSNIIFGCLSIIATIALTIVDYQYVYGGIMLFYCTAIIQRYCLIRRRLFSLPGICLARPLFTLFIFLLSRYFLENNILIKAGASLVSWLFYAVLIGILSTLFFLVFGFVFERKQVIRMLRMIRSAMNRV